MSVRPKIHLYLVHQETGQRYPVGEEVVIGRTSGDIIFADDANMSNQHCRILRLPTGIGIHDLGSANGTYVDGIRLNPEKVYVFKPGNSLTTGHQVFKLQQPNLTKRITPKRRLKKKKKKQRLDTLSLLAGILTVGCLVFFAQLYFKAKWAKESAVIAPIQSPFMLVEKEMKAAFTEYSEMGKAHNEGQLSDKGLANGIRKFLVPRLKASYEKFGIIKPSGEYEKRKVAANRKLILALIDQVNAVALHAEKQTSHTAAEVERFTAKAAAANEQAQKLDASRTPSNYDY